MGHEVRDGAVGALTLWIVVLWNCAIEEFVALYFVYFMLQFGMARGSTYIGR